MGGEELGELTFTRIEYLRNTVKPFSLGTDCIHQLGALGPQEYSSDLGSIRECDIIYDPQALAKPERRGPALGDPGYVVFGKLEIYSM